MKNFLGNLAVKFQKFMYGRYGADSLYKALFWIYLAVIFIAMILGRTINFRIYYILGGAATLIIIFAFYRFFSKNLEKRRAENANWLKFTGAIKKEFKLIQNKWKFRKTHIFKKCPNCKTVLRMKRVKGTHSVNCPHCGKKFSFKVL